MKFESPLCIIFFFHYSPQNLVQSTSLIHILWVTLTPKPGVKEYPVRSCQWVNKHLISCDLVALFVVCRVTFLAVCFVTLFDVVSLRHPQAHRRVQAVLRGGHQPRHWHSPKHLNRSSLNWRTPL